MILHALVCMCPTEGDCYAFAEGLLDWGIRNAYKDGTPVVRMFLSPPQSERRGADGIDARA
jgi:hypothetical protein